MVFGHFDQKQKCSAFTFIQYIKDGANGKNFSMIGDHHFLTTIFSFSKAFVVRVIKSSDCVVQC